MNNEIDITFVPEGCPSDCPILTSSQSAALSVAAEAQSLFQGFLRCLDKMLPESRLNPEFKKGAQMLGHFTQKLDHTLSQEYNCSTQCDYVASGGTCPHKQTEQHQRQNKASQLKVDSLNVENQQLQDKCNELEATVESLVGELSKRRTQYNNRILIEIFEDHYQLSDAGSQGTFFDIVPRERLSDFIPFIRNIVLGPAVSEKFDEQIELAIEPYKNEFGVIPVHKWKGVLKDVDVRHTIEWLTDVLYDRCQRKEAFQSLVRRKSPVSLKKMPQLVALFESMGMQGSFNAMAS